MSGGRTLARDAAAYDRVIGRLLSRRRRRERRVMLALYVFQGSLILLAAVIVAACLIWRATSVGLFW